MILRGKADESANDPVGPGLVSREYNLGFWRLPGMGYWDGTGPGDGTGNGHGFGARHGQGEPPEFGNGTGNFSGYGCSSYARISGGGQEWYGFGAGDGYGDTCGLIAGLGHGYGDGEERGPHCLADIDDDDDHDCDERCVPCACYEPECCDDD